MTSLQSWLVRSILRELKEVLECNYFTWLRLFLRPCCADDILWPSQRRKKSVMEQNPFGYSPYLVNTFVKGAMIDNIEDYAVRKFAQNNCCINHKFLL